MRARLIKESINERFVEDPQVDGSAEENRLESSKVNYMELKKSEFKCGHCEYSSKSGYCNHKDVLAQVNLEKGCCNLYEPTKQDKVSVSNWAVNTHKGKFTGFEKSNRHINNDFDLDQEIYDREAPYYDE